jgi:hypothetical protein
MKIKIVIGSIFGVALLLVASFISVVGYQSAQSSAASSPLFTVRTAQAIEQTPESGQAMFLGKGTPTYLFPTSGSPQGDLIQQALSVVQAHPLVFVKLLENLNKYPYVAGLLEQQGLKVSDLRNYLHMVQQNPSLLADAIQQLRGSVSDTTPGQPLGLSTSSALGCFIVALVALLPITVTLVLVLLFFTLRILTCLNVNDCANTLAQQILSQLLQGLSAE